MKKSKPVVMVVDSREIFDAVAATLDQEFDPGRLIHCATLEAAMEIIDSATAVDFILSDWKIAGAYFLEAVRRDPETRHTPVVVLSENDTDQIIAGAMRAGASDFLAKPFLTRALVDRVRRVTRFRERRNRSRVRLPAGATVALLLPAGGDMSLELFDMSINGCSARGPVDLCGKLRIYEHAALRLKYAQWSIGLRGQLIRMEHDPEAAHPGGTILIAFSFGEPKSKVRQDLEGLLDDLYASGGVEQG